MLYVYSDGGTDLWSTAERDSMATATSLFFLDFSARMSLKEPICYGPSRLHGRRGWEKRKIEKRDTLGLLHITT